MHFRSYHLLRRNYAMNKNVLRFSLLLLLLETVLSVQEIY